MTFWNEIYLHFDRVAFSIFGIQVHWYGIMYGTALLSALWIAKYFVKNDNFGISISVLDSYFLWVEIGVIIGARLGYVFIYDTNKQWYLQNPLEIFNPFEDGKFIGISGMSYHGAVLGFLVATFLFCKLKKLNIWKLLDLCAISIPLGYIFGRIGNFLNKELVGRVSDVSWAIDVDGVMRHPSQLYEAFFEGFVIFMILFFYRKYKKFDGELMCLYTILYTLARFGCEYFREPDSQLGFIFFGLSMGQILSILMFVVGILFYIYLSKKRIIK